EIGDGSGRRSFWIHPGVPLQFRTFTSGREHTNRLWIDELMTSASGPSGPVLTPEPNEAPTVSAHV
ncbi:MAG: ATP-dependent DNA ligase, partial [Mycetocola sp.]